jgi:hypothetical protein
LSTIVSAVGRDERLAAGTFTGADTALLRRAGFIDGTVLLQQCGPGRLKAE